MTAPKAYAGDRLAATGAVVRDRRFAVVARHWVPDAVASLRNRRLAGRGSLAWRPARHCSHSECQRLKSDGAPRPGSRIVWKNPVSSKDEAHPGGDPVGFIIELENGFRIYHMGDTGLFGDLTFIADYYRPWTRLRPRCWR